MQNASHALDGELLRILNKRREESLFRYLQYNPHLLDFCSNDYLSFARSPRLKQRTEMLLSSGSRLSGATGSRSISGNTDVAEALEKAIAGFHHAGAGLLFNSGYDANTGLFSSLGKKDDTYICDELIHASIIDGCRLSHATRFRFAHNDPDDLAKKLKQAKGNVFVAVESLYSMDGDRAPLKEIAELCNRFGAHLIVDEAHATGVFGDHGRGLVNQLGLEDAVFARVHTFGKAMGTHGAIVLGSPALRDYLINFARSFIFTTALPVHSLFAVQAAYEELMSETFDNSHLHRLIGIFREGFTMKESVRLIDSTSPIQSIVIPGNARARQAASALQAAGFDVRAILSPSVPPGKERMRVSLHMHNTEDQVRNLLSVWKGMELA